MDQINQAETGISLLHPLAGVKFYICRDSHRFPPHVCPSLTADIHTKKGAPIPASLFYEWGGELKGFTSPALR